MKRLYGQRPRVSVLSVRLAWVLGTGPQGKYAGTIARTACPNTVSSGLNTVQKLRRMHAVELGPHDLIVGGLGHNTVRYGLHPVLVPACGLAVAGGPESSEIELNLLAGTGGLRPRENNHAHNQQY